MIPLLLSGVLHTVSGITYNPLTLDLVYVENGVTVETVATDFLLQGTTWNMTQDRIFASGLER